MNINKIDLKELEAKLSPVRTENEVRAVLRRALERLGPDGEHWGQGGCCTRPQDTYCALAAIHGDRVPAYYDIQATPAGRALIRAVGAGDISSVWEFNDRATSFSEVRAMFEKAIVLAGQS